MKKVEAIIRPEKLEAVISKLSELSYPGVTITEVRGHGKQKGVRHLWRGTEYSVPFLPKVKIEVVVLDGDLSRVMGAIADAARTGSIGDGKIFVTEVIDALRIRTGHSGEKAV